MNSARWKVVSVLLDLHHVLHALCSVQIRPLAGRRPPVNEVYYAPTPPIAEL